MILNYERIRPTVKLMHVGRYNYDNSPGSNAVMKKLNI